MARTSGYRLSAVVKAMWRYATRRASKQKRRLLRFPGYYCTITKLHGSDNRGGIIVKTGKEHLLTYSFIIIIILIIIIIFIIFIIIIINRDLGRKKIAPVRGKNWQVYCFWKKTCLEV